MVPWNSTCVREVAEHEFGEVSMTQTPRKVVRNCIPIEVVRLDSGTTQQWLGVSIILDTHGIYFLLFHAPIHQLPGFKVADGVNASWSSSSPNIWLTVRSNSWPTTGRWDNRSGNFLSPGHRFPDFLCGTAWPFKRSPVTLLSQHLRWPLGIRSSSSCQCRVLDLSLQSSTMVLPTTLDPSGPIDGMYAETFHTQIHGLRLSSS